MLFLSSSICPSALDMRQVSSHFNSLCENRSENKYCNAMTNSLFMLNGYNCQIIL